MKQVVHNWVPHEEHPAYISLSELDKRQINWLYPFTYVKKVVPLETMTEIKKQPSPSNHIRRQVFGGS